VDLFEYEDLPPFNTMNNNLTATTHNIKRLPFISFRKFL